MSFKPMQQYKIAIAATASVAQKVNEIATILALGKKPIFRVSAISSHAIVKLGSSSAVSADASKVDVVTNGTFASDTGWTKGADWAIAAGVASATLSDAALSQTAGVALLPGYSYLLTFDATRAAGSVVPSVGGTAGTTRSSSATFAETIVAGATQLIEFTGTGFTETIDNVTCVPNLIPSNSFLVTDGAQPLDISVSSDVSHLSVISEDESDTGNLYLTVGYFE